MGTLIVLVLAARLLATFHVYRRWIFERVACLSQRIHIDILCSSVNTRLTAKESLLQIMVLSWFRLTAFPFSEGLQYSIQNMLNFGMSVLIYHLTI